MKSKEELNALKEEVETMSKKLHALTEEELKQVTGGGIEPVIEAAVLYRTGHVSVSERPERENRNREQRAPGAER